ncbi:MAG: phage head closure protein [Pleomorphochaeta sp.]
MSVESMFDKQAQIIKNISNSTGGWNPTKEKQFIPTRCKIRSLSSRNAFFAAKDVIIATHRIYLPINTNITTEDKISYQDKEFKIISDINKVENQFIQLDLKVIK